MARPPKQGLNYWPKDVHSRRDRKFRRIKLKYGSVGVDIYEILLDLIYGEKGYYLQYDENTKDDVIWEVQESLQGKYQPSAETIAEVIEDLVDCELFSEYHFKSKILTSKRIQSTYYSATVERKSIYIDYEIWMLDEEEMRALSNSSIILLNFINRPKNEDNRPNNEDNRPNNPQSKPDKSKGKKTKVNNTLSAEPTVYEQIVGYLNYVMGNTNFRATSKATQRHINGRLAEGYTVEDFKTVIDKKYLEWSQRPDMIQFMRPETLFCPKHFESYLNQAWTDGRSESLTEAALRRFTADEQTIEGSYEVIVQDGEDDVF